MDKETLNNRVYLSPIISADELVEMINKRAAELGRVPLREEFEFANLVKIKYGSWKRCLSMIDLDPKYSLTDEVLVEMVQAKAAELGRTPERTEFEYGSLIRPRFGSWNKFVLQAGLEPIKPKPKLTNEELIEGIQKRAAELGFTPSKNQFENSRVAERRYGSWIAFLLQAGLDPNQTRLNISNEELIESIQKEALVLGRTPLRSEFEKGAVAAYRFGGWSKFLQSAGLEPVKPRLSDEELIAAVQAKAAELGRTPLMREFFHNAAATKRFGSWANFLKRADLEHDGQYMSERELIKQINDLKAKLGRVPHKKEFKHRTLVDQRYSSWKAFLQQAGLEPKRLSDEELIASVQAEAKKLNRAPKRKEFPDHSQAVKRYGSWTAFLESAGLGEHIVGRRRPISNEELIELVLAKAEELGHTPSSEEFNHSSVATRRYGNWNNFLRSVGLEPRRVRTILTNEQLIELVQAKAVELGHAPTLTEFKHSVVAAKRYGSWVKFLQSAGLEVRTTKNRMRNEELIELVQAQAAELGQTPFREEFPYTSLAITRFGNWDNFLNSAGLEKRTLKIAISNEELIELLCERAAELGRTPRRREFLYGSLAQGRFGNWSNFVESAGLELFGAKHDLSDEQLLESLQAKIAELDRTPYRKEFEHGDLAVKRYGSWSNFVESAGLEVQTTRSAPSDDELIKLVQAKAKELGRVPSKREFLYSAVAASRHGSWNKFLLKAGLEAWVPKPMISNHTLIKDVRAKAKELGRTPLKKEFNQAGTAVGRFGSWKEFLYQAYLTPLNGKTNPTNKELIKLVQEQATELGITPLTEEFEHSKLAISRYGTWNDFLKSAGLKPCKDKERITNQQLIEIVQIKAVIIGRTPILKEFRLSNLAMRRYGSWNKFLESAGLEPNKGRTNLNCQQLIDLVKARADELGRVPTKEEFEYSKAAISKYGSFHGFLVDAGLKEKRAKQSKNNKPLDLWFLQDKS